MYEKIREELIKAAEKLFDLKKIDLLIGYTGDENQTYPIFIRNKEDLTKLVLNKRLTSNLFTYIKKIKKEIPGAKKVAIIAKGCDIKSAAVLIAENQIKREDIIIIALRCDGMEDINGNLLKKCNYCNVHEPTIYDFIFGKLEKVEEEKKLPDIQLQNEKNIKELEKKTREDRFKYFKEEFSRCIRCYACREVCPLCYCDQCISDKTMPAWLSGAKNEKENFSWNLIRAFHLAGRCTGCGACFEVCPMNIRIDIINEKLREIIYEKYNYVSGSKIDSKFPIITYNINDKEDFIK